MKRISQKTVAIRLVGHSDVDNIHLSSELEQYLVKNPIFGPSDYTDLPGVEDNVTSSWRQFSPAGRRGRLQPRVLSEEAIRKREEAKARRQLKMAGLQQKREELMMRRALKRKIHNQIKESGGSESSQEFENEYDSNSDSESPNIIISSPNKKRVNHKLFSLKSSKVKRKVKFAKEDTSHRLSDGDCKTDIDSKTDNNTCDGGSGSSNILNRVTEGVGFKTDSSATEDEDGNEVLGANNFDFNKSSKKSQLIAAEVKSSARKSDSKHRIDRDKTWSTNLERINLQPKVTRIRRTERVNYTEDDGTDLGEEDFHFKPAHSTKSGRKVIPVTRKLEEAIVTASMAKSVKKKRKDEAAELSESASTITSNGAAVNKDPVETEPSFHDAQNVVTNLLLNSQKDIESINKPALTLSGTENNLKSSVLPKDATNIDSQNNVSKTVTANNSQDPVISKPDTQKAEYDSKTTNLSLPPSSILYPNIPSQSVDLKDTPPMLQHLRQSSAFQQPLPRQQQTPTPQQPLVPPYPHPSQRPPPPLISFTSDTPHSLHSSSNRLPPPSTSLSSSSSSSSFPSSDNHFLHPHHHQHPSPLTALPSHSQTTLSHHHHHQKQQDKIYAALMAAATGQTNPTTTTAVSIAYLPPSSSTSPLTTSPMQPNHAPTAPYNFNQFTQMLYQPRPANPMPHSSTFFMAPLPMQSPLSSHGAGFLQDLLSSPSPTLNNRTHTNKHSHQGIPKTSTNAGKTQNSPVNHCDIRQHKVLPDNAATVCPKTKAPQNRNQKHFGTPPTPKGPSVISNPYHVVPTLSPFLQNSKDHSSSIPVRPENNFLYSEERLVKRVCANDMSPTHNTAAIRKDQPQSRQVGANPQTPVPVPPPAHSHNTPSKPVARFKESSMREVENMLNDVGNMRQGKTVPPKSASNSTEPSASHKNTKAESVLTVAAMLTNIKTAYEKKMKAVSTTSQSDTCHIKSAEGQGHNNSKNVHSELNRQPLGKSSNTKTSVHQPSTLNHSRIYPSSTQLPHSQAQAVVGLSHPQDSSFYLQACHDPRAKQQQQHPQFEPKRTVNAQNQSTPRVMDPPPAHQNRQPALPPAHSMDIVHRQGQQAFQGTQSPRIPPNPLPNPRLSYTQQQQKQSSLLKQQHQHSQENLQSPQQQHHQFQQDTSSQQVRLPVPQQPTQPHATDPMAQARNAYAQFNLRPSTSNQSPATYSHHSPGSHPSRLSHPKPTSDDIETTSTPTPPSSKNGEKPSNTISSPALQDSSMHIDATTPRRLEKDQHNQQQLQTFYPHKNTYSKAVPENITLAATGNHRPQTTSDRPQDDNPSSPVDSKMSFIIKRHLQHQKAQTNSTHSDPSSHQSRSRSPLQSSDCERESSSSPVDSKMALILQRQSQQHSHLVTKPILPRQDSPNETASPPPLPSLSSSLISNSPENLPPSIDSKIALHKQLRCNPQLRGPLEDEPNSNTQTLSSASAPTLPPAPSTTHGDLPSPVDSKILLAQRLLQTSRPPKTPAASQPFQKEIQGASQRQPGMGAVPLTSPSFFQQPVSQIDSKANVLLNIKRDLSEEMEDDESHYNDEEDEEEEGIEDYDDEDAGSYFDNNIDVKPCLKTLQQRLLAHKTNPAPTMTNSFTAQITCKSLVSSPGDRCVVTTSSASPKPTVLASSHLSLPPSALAQFKLPSTPVLSPTISSMTSVTTLVKPVTSATSVSSSAPSSTFTTPSTTSSSSTYTRPNEEERKGMQITIGTSSSLVELISIKRELSEQDNDEEDDYEEQEEESFDHGNSSGDRIKSSPLRSAIPFSPTKALQGIVPTVKDPSQISSLIGSISPANKANPPVESSVVGGLIECLALFRDRMKEKKSSQGIDENNISSPSQEVSALKTNEHSISAQSQEMSVPDTNENSISTPSQEMSVPDADENSISTPSQEMSVPKTSVSTLPQEMFVPETDENSISIPLQEICVPEINENSISAISQERSVPETDENSISTPSQERSVPETIDNTISSPSQERSVPETDENSISIPSQETSVPGTIDSSISSPSQETSVPETDENSISSRCQVTSVSKDAENSISAPSEECFVPEHNECSGSNSIPSEKVSVEKINTMSSSPSVPETDESICATPPQEMFVTETNEGSSSIQSNAVCPPVPVPGSNVNNSSASSQNVPEATDSSPSEHLFMLRKSKDESLTTLDTSSTLPLSLMDLAEECSKGEGKTETDLQRLAVSSSLPDNDKRFDSMTRMPSDPTEPTPMNNISLVIDSKDMSEAEDKVPHVHIESTMVPDTTVTHKPTCISMCTSTAIPHSSHSSAEMKIGLQADDCTESMEWESSVESSCRQQEQSNLSKLQNIAPTANPNSSIIENRAQIDTENSSHNDQSPDSNRLLIHMETSASEIITAVENNRLLESDVVVNNPINDSHKVCSASDGEASLHLSPQINAQYGREQVAVGDAESSFNTSCVNPSDVSVKQNGNATQDSSHEVGDAKEKVISPLDCGSDIRPPLVMAEVDSSLDLNGGNSFNKINDSAKEVDAPAENGNSCKEVKCSASNLCVSLVKDGESCALVKDGNIPDEMKGSLKNVDDTPVNDGNICNEMKEPVSNVVNTSIEDKGSCSERENSSICVDYASVEDANSHNSMKESDNNIGALIQGGKSCDDMKKSASNADDTLGNADNRCNVVLAPSVNSCDEMKDSTSNVDCVSADRSSCDKRKDSSSSNINDIPVEKWDTYNDLSDPSSNKDEKACKETKNCPNAVKNDDELRRDNNKDLCGERRAVITDESCDISDLNGAASDNFDESVDRSEEPMVADEVDSSMIETDVIPENFENISITSKIYGGEIDSKRTDVVDESENCEVENGRDNARIELDGRDNGASVSARSDCVEAVNEHSDIGSCDVSEAAKIGGSDVIDIDGPNTDSCDDDLVIIGDDDDNVNDKNENGQNVVTVVGISAGGMNRSGTCTNPSSNVRRRIFERNCAKAKEVEKAPLLSSLLLPSVSTASLIFSGLDVAIGDVNIVEVIDDDEDHKDETDTAGSRANNSDGLSGMELQKHSRDCDGKNRTPREKDLATALHIDTNNCVVEIIDDDDDDDNDVAVISNATRNVEHGNSSNNISSPKLSSDLSQNANKVSNSETMNPITNSNSVVEILSSDEEESSTGNKQSGDCVAGISKEATASSVEPVPTSRLRRLFSGASDDGVSSRSSHSPLSSPSGSGGVVSRCIQTLGMWTKTDVAQWLARNKLDKICLNLTNLDGPGLQRMAFEYNRSPEAFYVRVKKTLGLTLFQTLVIERSLKSLINSMVSDY